MKNKIKNEIIDHPIMAVLFLIISTIVTTLGTTTFATMGYVDKRYVESKAFTEKRYQIIKEDVNSKHSEIRSDMKEIKRSIMNVNNNILKLYKEK